MNRGNPAVEKLIQANIEMKQQRRGRERTKLISKITVESLMSNCKIIEELPEIPNLSNLRSSVTKAPQLKPDEDRKRSLDLDEISHPKKPRKNLVEVKEVAANPPTDTPTLKFTTPKITPIAPKFLENETTNTKPKSPFRIPAAISWNRQIPKLKNSSITKPPVKIVTVSSDEEEENVEWQEKSKNAFITAKDKLVMDTAAKYGRPIPKPGKRLGARGGFVSPLNVFGKSNSPKSSSSPLHESLKGCDPQLVERIEQEIMASQQKVDWDEIAGLEHAKKSINEAVVWPLQNPKLFTGIRAPPKGLLLFGPPGIGAI